MRIALAADHAGFPLKETLHAQLRADGHDVLDLGPGDTTSVDYPDFAAAVGRAVGSGDAECGILVCGTGIGMAIAANKVPGVRAANCNDLYMAELARQHNDANILTLGSRVVATEHATAIVQTFLDQRYAAGRHQRRLDKIQALET